MKNEEKLKYRQKHWSGKTIEQILKIDKTVETFAAVYLYAKRHSINIVNNGGQLFCALCEKRKKTWSGRTVNEIIKLGELQNRQSILQYAKLHNIEISTKPTQDNYLIKNKIDQLLSAIDKAYKIIGVIEQLTKEK